MNPLQIIDNLIRLMENEGPLFLTAQETMLKARERMEIARMELKELRLSLVRDAEGKNAEQREAWIEAQPQVQDLVLVEARFTGEFNAAYRTYMGHKANIDYIRDMRALVQLRSDINPAF